MQAWRSTASASRFLLVSLPLFALGSGHAAADKPKVGLVPFQGGPQGAKAAKVVYNTLKDKVDLVALASAPTTAKPPLSKAAKGKKKAKGAKGRKGKGKGTAVAPVAAAAPAAPPAPPSVEAYITGAFVPKKGLFIAVTSIATGKIEKLAYPAKGPTISYATFEKIAQQVAPAVEAALNKPLGDGGAAGSPVKTENQAAPGSATGSPGESASTAGTPSSPGQPGVTPAPGQPGSPNGAATTAGKPAQPAVPLAKRPTWAPYFDVDVSAMISGRNFSLSEAGTPSFSKGVGTGLRLDATVYPMARLALRNSMAWRAAAGLGVGVTADLLFWPASTVVAGAGVMCARPDAMGRCLDAYATNEYRVEAGLRWNWNILGRDDRPSVLALAQYGTHHFNIGKRTQTNPDGTSAQVDVGPPDVAYQYVTLGVGGRVPFKDRFALQALLQIHALADQGPIQSKSEYGQYGSGGGYGMRASLGFDARVYRGLYVGLSGFYEQFGLTFVPPPAGTTAYFRAPPCPCATNGTATDQYYGGALTVGYRY